MSRTNWNQWPTLRGSRGWTREWGFFHVERVCGGRVIMRCSGGRGRPGVFETTRSILRGQAARTKGGES